MTAMLIAAAAVTSALLAAAGLARERSRRARSDEQAAALQQQLAAKDEVARRARHHEKEWLAVLAHEIRSPVGAILGYGELLGDGMFGKLSDQGADAVNRMNRAAEQILRLAEGVELLAADADAPPDEDGMSSAASLMRTAAEALRFEAEARGCTILVGDGDAFMPRGGTAAGRALTLTLGAALKVSSGSIIRMDAHKHDHHVRFTISGSSIHPVSDEPPRADADDVRLSGAGLRIALARVALQPARGSVTMLGSSPGDGATDLVVSVPAPPAVRAKPD
jgi:signal transduction histidine kinase